MILFEKSQTNPLYAKLVGQGVQMREQRQDTGDFYKELFSILGSFSARVFRTPTLLNRFFELVYTDNILTSQSEC